MFGHKFGRRESHDHHEEMQDQEGTPGQRYRNQILTNQSQQPFQNSNWNGLSPRNRENQAHYQSFRKSAQPPNYESEDWPESGEESPVTRKRLASPMPVNEYPIKRVRGQNDQFTAQRQMPPPSARNTQLYSSTEFRLPYPVESSPRRSSWLGPDIPNGERWGSVEGGGFGQMSSPQIPRKANGYGVLLEDHRRNGYANLRGDNRTESRQEQRMMPDTFHGSHSCQKAMSMAPDPYWNSPYQQNGMQAAQDGQTGYNGRQFVDLTTPERVKGRRMAAQTSTTSSSSTTRRATETEPTDIENNHVLDYDDYKSSRMQTYIPTGGVPQDRPKMSQPRNRAQSVMPSAGNAYPSQFGQSSRHDNYGNSFSCNPVHRQADSTPIVPYFVPGLKAEDNCSQNELFRGSSGHITQNNNYRSTFPEDDPEPDENDTLEDSMRKMTWLKKAKAAGKASRSILSKPTNFGGSRRNESDYSSQDADAIMTREKAQEDTLSRIRGPEASKMTKQSSPHDMSTLLINSGTGRHGVIKQTAAQKAHDLAKERATLRRQRQAAETISQRQKQAKLLQSSDDLFEEAPADNDRLARIQMSKEMDKAKKEVNEEAKIIEGGHKEIQERLEAVRKQRLAAATEEFNAEKMQRVEQKRQENKKREEERMNVKRKSAAEKIRRQQVMDEEARLERTDRLQAGLETAKKQAATLQSFKRTNNKPNSTNSPFQGKEPEILEDSGDVSDGGLFVVDDGIDAIDEIPEKQSHVSAVEEALDEPPKKQSPIGGDEVIHEPPKKQSSVGVDDEVIDKPANVQKPEMEATAVNDIPGNVQKETENTTVNDIPDSSQKPEMGTAEIYGTSATSQKPDTKGEHPEPQSSTALPAVQEPEIVPDKEENPATTIVSETNKTKVVAGGPQIASNETASSADKTRVRAPPLSGTFISAIASDGRRRPPEICRPRVARRASTDSIRFTGGTRTTRHAQSPEQKTRPVTSNALNKSQNKSVDRAESQTEAILQKALKNVENLQSKAIAEEAQRKKEWDERFKKLGEILMPQDREDVAVGKPRPGFGKNCNLTAFPSARHTKSNSLTSQIDFVSKVESQARDKKKMEQDRIAKYEKDKAVRRKRYDREIRVVLGGQGVAPDDEKVLKQVNEKMAIWDENRRKKDRRDSGRQDLFASLGQPNDPPASDAEQDGVSPSTLQNVDHKEVKDPEARKEQERAQAMRAGVEFLASQNKTSNDFANAASRFRIQDFDSDESEEDPDDEPETQTISAVQPILGESDETADKMTGVELVGLEMDESLNSTTLDASIIPPLPRIPEPPQSKTAFLPDIVNPKEEDMMHSYTVKHRAARGDNVYETLILGSFHSLEEANAFAQEKLSEFYLGPGTGKSETHTSDNLYLGRVITDKDKDHDEVVWVTREIVYIGDTANIKRGDLKNIIAPKVFNVIQMMEDGDGKWTGSVIATASIKSLANKKATDLYLRLTKPSRPKIDSMAFYHDLVIPSVRQKLVEAEDQDATLDLEGVIPDMERSFSIFISETPVLGPLN